METYVLTNVVVEITLPVIDEVEDVQTKNVSIRKVKCIFMNFHV